MERPPRSQCHHQDLLAREGLPLVRSIVAAVSRRVPRYVDRDELVSAGMEGLAQAIHAYDPARGVDFEHFARRRIRGAVLDELRRKDWAGRTVRTRVTRVKAASEHLTASLGRTPTVDELAEAVSMHKADVIEVQDQQARAARLERLLAAGQPTDESAVPSQTPSPEAVVLEQELASCVRDAVSLLPERLRRAVVGHYGEGREMQDVAEELGVTPSRVSQLCSQAIGLLREGVAGHLDGEVAAARPQGVAARRRSAYVAAVDELVRRRHRRRPAVPAFVTAA